MKPGHSISYKIACAHIEGSDQPPHRHIISRVSAVRLKKALMLATHRAQSNDFDHLAGCSESLLDGHAVL